MAVTRSMMIVGLTALAMTACSPEIGSGTYFCGPEQLCPPSQTCNGPTHTCESDVIAQPFACPMGSEDYEPDDDMASARVLDDVMCGQTILGAYTGCISEGGDADLVTFVNNTTCMSTDPHIEIRMRYAIAFVPLVVEVLDDQGAVIATGELCTASNDLTGMERQCIDIPNDTGTFYIRVSPESDAPDCDGECQYNEYVLDISNLLS
jgi:hypothetical protein